jgi:hypothetical protein
MVVIGRTYSDQLISQTSVIGRFPACQVQRPGTMLGRSWLDILHDHTSSDHDRA